MLGTEYQIAGMSTRPDTGNRFRLTFIVGEKSGLTTVPITEGAFDHLVLYVGSRAVPSFAEAVVLAGARGKTTGFTWYSLPSGIAFAEGDPVQLRLTARVVTGTLEEVDPLERKAGRLDYRFDLKLRERIWMHYKDMRDHAFDVTNGMVVKAQRIGSVQRQHIDGRARKVNKHWRMTVRPTDPDKQVSISLPSRQCSEQGAVCTPDAERLNDNLTLDISAAEQLSVSIADADADEDDGYLKFDATLSRSSEDWVELYFKTTAEGTATGGNYPITAGVDYIEVDGWFVFVPGETSKEIWVPLIDDDIDDDGETVVVQLTEARLVDAYSSKDYEHLVPIDDDKATGTIGTVGGRMGPSGKGFSLAPENSRPSGLWSDGETAWVADLEDARLYAYSREGGERVPGKDIATGPAPMGLWSDGKTLWVADLGGGLRAHRLADGTRQPWRDLVLEANAAPAGVWSDGETAWVSEWLGDTVHAYRLADGRRAAGRDIKLAGGNLLPMGLWSDGEALWVADWRERVYAYRLSDGGREPSLDVAAGAADTDPTGLWSGGGTLLSTSWDGGEVRAYRLPALPALAGGPGKGKEGFLRARAASLPLIADPALLAAIKAALGKAFGESVSAAQLAGLETLEARNGGIRDLAGLEGATSLKELDLGFNPVADLRPLALLPALESLTLDGTAPDLQLLASLAGLRRLSLRSNGIDDLQPLASLAGLTALELGDNRIGDLSPLAPLTGLRVLRADRNRIADLWPLASLAGLEVLELGSNRVRDLHPLAGLTQLRSLRLEGNGLTELHPLAGLERLRDLGLAGNAVASVGALADLGGLRRLDLRGNAVEDLRPLRALPSLAWVHVGGSRIKDLAPLDNLSGLTVVGRDDRDSPSVAGEADARASRQ